MGLLAVIAGKNISHTLYHLHFYKGTLLYLGHYMKVTYVIKLKLHKI